MPTLTCTKMPIRSVKTIAGPKLPETEKGSATDRVFKCHSHGPTLNSKVSLGSLHFLKAALISFNISFILMPFLQ